MQRLQKKVDGRCDGACPCRERTVNVLILLACGAALLAYFIYNVYRYATQPTVTIVSYQDQPSLATPGVILCPPDSVDTTRQYGVFPQVFFQTLSDTVPVLNNNCSFYPNTMKTPITCGQHGSFVVYAFSTLETTNRTCYDVRPGAVEMTDPNDSMWLYYTIYQRANTSLPNYGYTVSNNLFYGLYTNDHDRATAPVRLAAASGVTVISFQIDKYEPLHADSYLTYSVFSSSTSANRPEASTYIAVNSTFPGTDIPTPAARFDSGFLILQPSQLSITVRTDAHVFGWTDVLGAIGGVFSIVMSVRVFLSGQENDPEQDKGFIKRVFFASQVTPEQAAESDTRGAKLNTELEELRRRAQYNTDKTADAPQ